MDRSRTSLKARRRKKRFRQLNKELKHYAGELEERVAERTADLEARTRELETFTYSVSHDLKAPLRGIDGYSRLLLEDYADKLAEEGRTFLTNVRQAATQMGRLIEDLLAYSRLERRTWQSGEVSIPSLVEVLLSEWREEIAGAKCPGHHRHTVCSDSTSTRTDWAWP